MIVLITGITGFAGSHFAEYALREGASVAGSRLPGTPSSNIDHIRSGVDLFDVDLRDASAVRRLLDVTQPDWIVHLAAQSSVGGSWDSPADTLGNNVLSQLNILEAIRQSAARPRMLIAGSADEYGDVEDGELPIHENVPFRPLSPYAVSKVAQDVMGYQYWRSHELPIIRARAFNHEGPRRGEAFVTSSFALQIAEIEAGLREPVVRVGNLKARRDYTDVRDIVRGYWLLLKDGEAGDVYNVCSGRAWSIKMVLDFLLAQARTAAIEVREDVTRLRAADVPVLVGDPTKIQRAVGWRPEIPFEQTLRDVLDYWRQQVAGRHT